MLKIYNIKEKQEFLREVAILTQKEWGSKTNSEEEFRGKGYSKILNNAILEEAKNRGFNKLYLKTDLINYYEKFGATFLENLNNREKLYYFDLEEVLNV